MRTFRDLYNKIMGSRCQNVSLRRRMIRYLLGMLLLAVGVLILILAGCGLILNAEDRMAEALQSQLESVSAKMEDEVEDLEGYALNLARQLSRSMEYQMEHGDFSAAEFNDSAEKLLELQRAFYGDLNATLLMSGSSGAFAVTDATVNTGLEESSHSRSGLYLRANNIGRSVRIVPDPVLFRGSAEIAREKGLELHSRWNLEFDVNLLPEWGKMMGQDGNVAGEILWTEKMRLRDTWEDVLLLCTPIKGSMGNAYGICGLELSELFFREKYPAQESDFGTMITLIATLEDEELHVERGMLGDAEGTWLEGMETLSRKAGKKFQTFTSGRGDFLGVMKDINLPVADGKRWVAAILVPQNSGISYIRKSRWMLMAAAVFFSALMLIMVAHASKRFVRPILQVLDDIKGKRQGDEATGRPIAELEELKSFLTSRRENQKLEQLPENIEEMLREFKRRVETLTPTERTLLNYYTEDFSLEEIAEKMFISIGTAKKHNTNLNRKLDISSRSQLMVYVELFKRCDRLDDIKKQTTT